MPKQMWLTSVFGGASRASLPTAANSLVLVFSWTWHSTPMVGLYLARTSVEIIAKLPNLSKLGAGLSRHSGRPVGSVSGLLHGQFCSVICARTRRRRYHSGCAARRPGVRPWYGL